MQSPQTPRKLPTEAPEDEVGLDVHADARTSRPLEAHGSHRRRIRRPRQAVARPVHRPVGTALRAAIAIVVLGVFAGLVLAGGLAAFQLTSGAAAAVLGVFGLLSAGHFGASLWHAFQYRPVPAFRSPKALPRVTVIVPAFNEGPAVRVALESALAADYPAEKLRVIAIDDGSADDTWTHIEEIARAHRGRVLAIRQPVNRGKREALRVGFERADSEIVVTVDSDSRIDRAAIREIVAPLVADREVAAVAGRVLVLNRADNLLTRFLSARFFVTFDLARAAQSQFGAVLCTPGALSAYRLRAVRQVVERWSAQTFFGAPCTIGEDRALTTWLLRAGYRSVYQRTAVVDTLMPKTLRGIARTLVRWERGNVRENFVMLPVLLTRWRTADRWWPTFDIGLELLQHPLAYAGLAMAAASLLAHPGALAMLLGCVLFGFVVQALYCLRSERLGDFFYGVGWAAFAFFGLQWVFPYSLLTVRDGRWLTR